MEKNISTATDILKAFILAMNGWEVGYYHKVKEQGLAPLQEVMGKDLTDIFNKYCTIKERKYGKPGHFSVRNPPVYSSDEEILKNEEIKGNKVTIYTQQKTGIENQFRYTLHYKNNEWRVDKKEVYDEFDNRWEKYPL